MTVEVKVVEQQSALLGRNMVHDERSRAFALPRKAIDRSSWRDKSIRVYDPRPNPNQPVGCCTHVAKANQFNAVGNRRKGVVLDMDWVLRGYAKNTEKDPYPGTFTYDPLTGAMGGDDTGSSALASCKTAVETGDGGEYRWDFDGGDGIVQNIMEGRAMSIGTWWYWDMFEPEPTSGLVRVGGGHAGGHQWVAHRYWASRRWVGGLCWWGGFRQFWMALDDLDALVRDGGDVHHQRRRLA
jgi:hypothetical protein